MADPQSPPLVLAARNILARPTASYSNLGLPVAPGHARSASARANNAPAAASAMDFALPLRRSDTDGYGISALPGGVQRVYSLVGPRMPLTSLRTRSASQGSLISAAVNPT